MRLFRVEIEILRLEKLHINGKNAIFMHIFLKIFGYQAKMS